MTDQEQWGLSEGDIRLLSEIKYKEEKTPLSQEEILKGLLY